MGLISSNGKGNLQYCGLGWGVRGIDRMVNGYDYTQMEDIGRNHQFRRGNRGLLEVANREGYSLGPKRNKFHD